MSKRKRPKKSRDKEQALLVTAVVNLIGALITLIAKLIELIQK